jgi:hypothetical protein
VTDTPFYVRALTAPIDIDETHGTGEVLVVPYDKPTPIVEHQPGRGRVTYDEVVRRGAAERAIRGGAGRIPFTYGHSDAFPDRMGVATRFWDGDDGLHAAVRFDPSKLGAVQDAVTSSHQGISMAFVSVVPKPFTEREGTLVERRSIIVLHLAAVPFAAYTDARVLAVRNAADDEDTEPTAADVAARDEAEEAARVLREARELVAAGDRWVAFRGEVSGA